VPAFTGHSYFNYFGLIFHNLHFSAQLKAAREEKEKQEKSVELSTAAAVSTAPSGKMN
jgi:hypothetical protein